MQVYRQIFQLARSWRAVEESETTVERAYIRDEARRLFRKNKNLTDAEEVKVCLEEAKARVELGERHMITCLIKG